MQSSTAVKFPAPVELTLIANVIRPTSKPHDDETAGWAATGARRCQRRWRWWSLDSRGRHTWGRFMKLLTLPEYNKHNYNCETEIKMHSFPGFYSTQIMCTYIFNFICQYTARQIFFYLFRKYFKHIIAINTFVSKLFLLNYITNLPFFIYLSKISMKFSICN